MAGNVQVWEAQRAWLGHRRLGVAQLGAAASLLAFLLAASCNHEGETHATGPTTGVGGGSGGNSNDSGGSGGNSSDGGAAGAQLGSGGSAGAPQSTGGNSGTTGTAGSAGSEEPGTPVCEPSAEAPADTCEYPESLGGGADPTRCGVTPGAWYPLGDSEMTTWPAPWNEPAFETRAHMHTTAVFDLQNQPIVGWVFDGLEMRRWNGDVWETLSLGELARTDTADLDLQLDSSGNLVVLEQFEASMRVLRSGDEGWTSLGEWPAAYGPASLAVDAKDRPVVVYGIDGRLHAKRWNGTSFKDLPGNEADGSLSEDAADADPRVAVRQNGDIVVAWAGTLDSAGRIIHIQRFHGGEWGSLSDSTGFPEFRLSSYYYAEPTFAVAVDSNDQVLLAWSEYDSGSVQVWDGTAWQPPEPGLWQPDLLQSLDGTVYLHGNEYSQEAEVWEWQAGDWIESPDLGGAVSGQLKAGRDGTFALASDGYQVAAWEGDYQAGYSRVSVELYADERWRTLDSPTDHGVGVHSGLTQELVASDAGWFLHDSSCGVARWDGGAWRNFDLSEWRTLPSCGGSTLTESPTGQLVLTMWVAQWQYPARDIDGRYPGYDFTVHVLGWNGEAWEPLTDRYDSYGLFEALSTAFDSKGSVFVAWSTLNDANYNTYRSGILAWDGAVWRELPDPRDWNPNNIQLTSLSDDRLLAVWYDEDGEAGWDEGYHAAIYEAGQWHDLPDPPASSAALSATQDKDGTPFLVVTSTTDADLVLYELAASGWRAVAPDEARLSTLPESVRTQVFREAGEVYLRRFEDCSWHGLSASDRGGGISNSAERSLTPSFATHAGTTCVTWTERFEKGSAQFLRCHD